MIWRLAHPVRGLVAGLLMFWLLLLVFAGFGVGYAELAIMVALAVVTTVLVGRAGSSTSRAEHR